MLKRLLLQLELFKFVSKIFILFILELISSTEYFASHLTFNFLHEYILLLVSRIDELIFATILTTKKVKIHSLIRSSEGIVNHSKISLRSNDNKLIFKLERLK